MAWNRQSDDVGDSLVSAWNRNNRCGDKSRAFWERLALRYPLPFEEKTLAETNRVIELVKSKGVGIRGAAVLDIGCGTGVFALPLASEAARVVGLDDSESMLARMAAVAAEQGLTNASSVTASWQSVDPSALGLLKAFDIVWVAMSPAVQTRQDFDRMEQCARHWCVYIGWGRKRRDALLEEIFRLHGLTFGPPPGARAAYEILVRTGRTPSLDYFETSWEAAETVANTLEEMAGYVETHGAKAQRDPIEQVLVRHERDGRVHHTTFVEEGLLVWPVK